MSLVDHPTGDFLYSGIPWFIPTFPIAPASQVVVESKGFWITPWEYTHCHLGTFPDKTVLF